MEQKERAVGFTALRCVFFLSENTTIMSRKNDQQIVGTMWS